MAIPLQILIVEDSEDDALLVLRELRRGGYDPVHKRVDTPEAMRAALKEQSWDIVLADYSLPAFSAPAALSLLKESGLDLPFIIVSGVVGEDVAVEAMKAGAQDYLTKGNLKRLVPAVQRELREAEGRRERRRLEGQLLQSQKMQMIGQLAGGIAHDFNNLLTAIKGYARMAYNALPGESPVRADIEQVLKAADRAANLTRQLLAFSRRQIITPQVLNPNDLILDMEKMLRRLIGEDIELQTFPSADLGAVNVDPGQIEQVLVNLVINARDAMPAGGTLTLSTANVTVGQDFARIHPGSVPGDYVLIEVVDTGTGMSAEVQEHLFEPFFTTKPVGRGTGLGLATVYGIVKQHQGNIYVESALGRGTRISIYLPRAAQVAAGASRLAERETMPRGSETVLIVEDDLSVRDLASRVLGELGYSILQASRAIQALRISREYAGTIHLLLSDVIMPQMNGRELARQVAGERPGIKVLFVSGHAAEIIAQHGVLDAGIELLQKPFTPEALANAVRQILDKPGVYNDTHA